MRRAAAMPSTPPPIAGYWGRSTLLAALAATPAMAHDPPAISPAGAMATWSFEWWVVALLVASLAMYGWACAACGGAPAPGAASAARQAACFAAGWLALALALTSPLDALGGALFSVHMVQHELLMVVAAPLFVMSRPLEAWTWALPAAWRQPLRPRRAAASRGRHVARHHPPAGRVDAARGRAVGLAYPVALRGGAHQRVAPFVAARELPRLRAALLVVGAGTGRAAPGRRGARQPLHHDAAHGRARRVAHLRGPSLVCALRRAQASASTRSKTSSSADW